MKYLPATFAVVVALGSASLTAAELPPGADRYLKLVRAYADCMIEHGRDTYGAAYTPLFAEALDRHTLKVLTGMR